MFVRTGKDVPVRSNSSARPPLSDACDLAVGQLGDLQHRIDFGGGSHQLAGALERAGELVKIAAEVDPVLEIAELTDRESKRPREAVGRRCSSGRARPSPS